MSDRFYVYYATVRDDQDAPLMHVSYVDDRECGQRTIAQFTGPGHGTRARQFCAELNAAPELQYEPVACTIPFEEPSEYGDALARAADWLEG